MDIDFFKREIEPMLGDYSFKYSSFPDGDLGSLERVELEGNQKIGTIDFWSKGFIGIDIYNIKLDDQQFNLLLGPDDEPSEAIATLMSILNDKSVGE